MYSLPKHNNLLECNLATSWVRLQLGSEKNEILLARSVCFEMDERYVIYIYLSVF